MEHQHEAAATSPIEQQAEKSGTTGNTPRRNRRIEIRVTHQERTQIFRQAFDADYHSIPTYVREIVLSGKLTSTMAVERKWYREIRYIRIFFLEISEALDKGQQPNEELLMRLAQLEERAGQIWEAVRQGTGIEEK